MKIFLLVSLAVILAFFTLASPASADEIILENGDRITGEIQMIADGTIRIATEYAGEICVDFAKVTDLSTDIDGRLSLANGDIISGRILSISDGNLIVAGTFLQEVAIPRNLLTGLNEPAGRASTAELVQARGQLEQTKADLEQAREQLDEKQEQIEKLSSVSELWSGSFSVGAQRRTGNSDSSDVRVAATAVRKAPREELQFKFHLDYGEAEGETDANEIFGEGKLKVFQSDRMYLFGVTSMEYDEMENLDLRAQVFGGPGYLFIKNERTNLLGEIGAGLTGEFYDEDKAGDDEENLEASLWLNAEWTQKLMQNAEFYQSITVFPSLGDFGDFRLRSESTITSPLGEQWAIKLSLIDVYNSAPQSDNIKKNDMKFISLVEYTY